MPLANVTQSLEARPTAQMFQEKRPREAKRAERNWLSAERHEFLNKTADFMVAGRQGFPGRGFRPFADSRGLSLNVARSAR